MASKPGRGASTCTLRSGEVPVAVVLNSGSKACEAIGYLDDDAMSQALDNQQVSRVDEPPPIPEHMVIMLLEGGQRVLGKLEEAIRSDEAGLKEHHSRKVLAIIEELHRRLNHEQGGELVGNLVKLYVWWRRELLLAVEQSDVERLKRVWEQMGEIRQAWEHVLFQGEGMSEGPIA